jgi:tetraacyldisaccharide 4'-kinase
MVDPAKLWSSHGIGASVARGLLLPAAALYRAGTAVRNALYDANVLESQPLGAPTISVGNLTAGGTGKTPMASWFASEIANRDVTPGILLRGYGGDETLVHRVLEPRAIVVANPDRVAGAARAVAEGAQMFVPDDGFQHRRARRDVDVVLVSADAFGGAKWPLPAGPWRESIGALQRATAVIITRKAATKEQANAVASDIAAHAGGATVGIVSLAAKALRTWPGGDNAERDLASIAGAPVLAVSGIGLPDAFEAQLRANGARVESMRFGDHHAFTKADAESIVARAEGLGAVVISTLKDAVKLAPFWPTGAPRPWYLSQRVTLEHDAASILRLLDGIAARVRDP